MPRSGWWQRLWRSIPPVTRKSRLTERIDRLALHPVLGYLLLILTIGGLLVWTFIIGAWMSEILTTFLSGIAPIQPLIKGSAVGYHL